MEELIPQITRASYNTYVFSFLLRIKSFNELNLMIKNNEFRELFRRGTQLQLVDTIRDTLKSMDIKVLKQINEYTVVAIDGTKLFGSNKKSCPECLRNKTHCFHSGAVMSIVGDI